jgi:hypothetical protein
MYKYFARMPHCIEFIVSPLACSFYAALADKSALYDFGTDEGCPNYRRRRGEKLGTAVKFCGQIKRAALNPNSALSRALKLELYLVDYLIENRSCAAQLNGSIGRRVESPRRAKWRALGTEGS